jgi:diaminohydroxyphosphoribosylaminopyrimidine deaminase/5-amino-6-(5-phosphoribosylamino)uracil reductase
MRSNSLDKCNPFHLPANTANNTLHLQPMKVVYGESDFMRRCLHLAGQALGHTQTNPLVGCIIINDGNIIGEGYHRKFGGPHAEIEAIANVQDKTLLGSSTLYVNLEPCCHFGKTPPCTDAIIQSGISRVAIAMQDPFPAVSGEGIAALRKAGIEVSCGLLEKEAQELNKRFITYHSKQRPYIILKWAQTSDGFTGLSNKRIQISGTESQIDVHRWRSEEQAILIGAQTALTDNPQLNVRHWCGPNPIRILFDPNGRCASAQHLSLFDGSMRTIVLTGDAAFHYSNAEINVLSDSSNPAAEIASVLHQLGISSVLVEGGPRLHSLFISASLWDECRIIQSEGTLHEGHQAPIWPAGQLHIEHNGSDYIHTIKRIS